MDKNQGKKLPVEFQDFEVNKVYRHFVDKGLPEHMWPGVARYIYEGVGVGHFLNAVISNDLARAVHYADDNNAKVLSQWVKFFYNQCPAGCWGSAERYRAWIERGGLLQSTE
jgi:hypothetical protein